METVLRRTHALQFLIDAAVVVIVKRGIHAFYRTVCHPAYRDNYLLRAVLLPWRDSGQLSCGLFFTASWYRQHDENIAHPRHCWFADISGYIQKGRGKAGERHG
ncbi:hypothetical protein LJC60_07525, partial [Ruminococcaceae bacterium OttesenSCG-928-D13]|nr:hypothetical protein [Ruminococcaceae bacterium OttesenSCG-928-D13]